ncbi:asparagine synthase [Thermobaculum terrenum ATCC BAA-798]|uniref:asparagine synthase (glutamine-hydrolyzing) n=1 Tax=Thermobaculum terrenum (strain ATCC BAA-798 / CCMEE 7001 / YNP1) TaxID=525904 RepID=D1CB97_THET1|nr:asparagine synthase-related protein [Thermobaculum terrenum]ACZ42062.1 asparagine synthase [Thermobaculum terrenum ATCC BAA-798]
MSGIVGVISFTDPVPSDLVKRIVASGMHRCGSAAAKHLGQVAVGCAELKITCEDFEDDQPLSFNGGRSWVVMDGRLDNRDELFDLLAVRSQQSSISDCRLAAMVYQRWGEHCVSKLVGNFALIIWDDRAKSMFCAVDHLATRPLFYTLNTKRFVVASTIKQILQVPGISDEIDDTYILANLCLQSTLPHHTSLTPYTSIRRLLPGHAIVTDINGRQRITRYWRPEELPVLYSSPRSEVIERVRATFKEAVRSQFRSCAAVMPTFSGGLDSSSIVCMAVLLQRESGLPCKGFRPVSETYKTGTVADESSFRRAAIKMYGLDVIEFPGDDLWYMRDLVEGTFPEPDEPFGAYLVRAEMQVYADVAWRSGCNVLVFGYGGDELMQGTSYFLGDYLRQLKIKELIHGIWSESRWPNLNVTTLLLRYAILPMVPPLFWRFSINIRGHNRRWNPETEWYIPGIPPWLSVQQCIKSGIFARVWKEFPEHYTPLPSRAQHLVWLRQNNFSLWLDNYVFMPKGCEARMPFMDRRFVELALMIPTEWKRGFDADGTIVTKLILREAMRSILPEAIRERRDKVNFGRTLALGLRHELPKLLNNRSWEVVERGYVEQDGLERALKSWRIGMRDFLPQICSLLATELWLRQMRTRSHEPGWDVRQMDLVRVI